MVAILTNHIGGLEGPHLLPRIAHSSERRSSFERALERADLSGFSSARSPSQPPLLRPPPQTTPEGRERNTSFDDEGRERHGSADGGQRAGHRRGPSSASCRPQSRHTPRPGGRRKVLCTWGGALGQRSLITVQSGLEPIKAPYTVIVSYDLRPALGALTGKESIYLAALDAEKLRRRGAGTGVDAMQASETWLARDCLCSVSGKLKPLTDVKGPGEVKLTLAPTLPKGESEACVLLRVVAVKNQQDPHDWYVLGSAVVLKIDMGKRLPQQGCRQLTRQMPEVDAVGGHEPGESTPTEEGQEGQDAVSSGPCGVPLQQLVDFHEDIQADLERYCSVHRLCAHGGRYKSYHVCMVEPCPYRPINKQRFCDHRGLLFVPRSSLDDEEVYDLEELAPDVQLVARRYVWPFGGKGTGKSRALSPDPQRTPKIGTFVSHSWAEPFAEFIQTLRRAMDREDYVFVPGLMLGNGAVIHGRSGGTGELEQRPFATSLKKADRLLLVADRAFGFARCLWCAFEVAKAKEWLLPALVWPHHAAEIGKLKDAIAHLDLQTASAEPEELRRLLVAGAKGAQADLEAANRQLRAYLQSRIHCFVSALQEASNGHDSNPERLRHLCVENERRAMRRETGREYSRCAEELEAEAQEHARALERHHAAAEAERQAHAAEARRYEEQLTEAAREGALLRDHHGETEASAQRMETDLEEAGRELAKLRAELEEERRRAEEEGKLLDQARREAATHAKRTEELEAEVKEERGKHVEEGKRWQEATDMQARQFDDMKAQAEEKTRQAEDEVRELSERLAQAEAALQQFHQQTHDEDLELRSNPSFNSHTAEHLMRGYKSLSRGNPLRLSSLSAGSGDSHLGGLGGLGATGQVVANKASELGTDLRQTLTTGVNFFTGKSKNKRHQDTNQARASGTLASLSGTLSSGLGSWGGGAGGLFSSKQKGNGEEDPSPGKIVETDLESDVSESSPQVSDNNSSPSGRRNSKGLGMVLKMPNMQRASASKNSN